MTVIVVSGYCIISDQPPFLLSGPVVCVAPLILFVKYPNEHTCREYDGNDCDVTASVPAWLVSTVTSIHISRAGYSGKFYIQESKNSNDYSPFTNIKVILDIILTQVLIETGTTVLHGIDYNMS